jgi:hypothetical protein
MAIQLDHIIVPSRNRVDGARRLASIQEPVRTVRTLLLSSPSPGPRRARVAACGGPTRP